MFGNGKKASDERPVTQRIAESEKALRDLLKQIRDENPDITVHAEIFLSVKRPDNELKVVR